MEVPFHKQFLEAAAMPFHHLDLSVQVSSLLRVQHVSSEGFGDPNRGGESGTRPTSEPYGEVECSSNQAFSPKTLNPKL